MNKLKQFRLEHRLTQREMSEITGVPFRTVQSWEAEDRNCPKYVEEMLLDKLDRMFNQPDYKTILEEILEMLKSDLAVIENPDAKQYIENVINEIEDSLK